MNEQVRKHVSQYPEEITALYGELRQIILDSVPCTPAETLWARLPTYSVGGTFVRLIPFKDHINIEAKAVLQHREALTDYKITPKGMLQIFLQQRIPRDALMQIFEETLA